MEAESIPHLDLLVIKKVLGIVGALLYYAQVVDNNMLVTLSAI